jgi:glycosyltransferase involved in cell wall biosynthesis
MSKVSNKIRILSQYFYPDVATTGQLLTDLAVGLASRQFEVEVLTAFPSYGSRIEASRRESFRNISIHRLWSTRLNKNSKFGKIFNSITFFLSVLIALLFSRSTWPLLIVSNPPFLPFVGYILRKIRNIPFIFLVHDVYPDIAIRLGYLSPKGLIQRCWNLINVLILRSSSHIVVLGDSMKDVVSKKMVSAGIHESKQKISIIHNWADEEIIRPVAKSENLFLRRYGLKGKFIVQYSGNLGLFHELENVIEAASKINDPDFVFLFIGEGGKKTKLEKMVAEYGLTNVMFLPYQDFSVLTHSLSAADVAIVSLEEGIEGLAMPSKLYTIMASGTPIVAFCDPNSDIADILNVSQSGFVFRHDDIDGFVAKLKELKGDRSLLQRMKINARLYFEEHFTFEKALVKYEKILLSLKVEER